MLSLPAACRIVYVEDNDADAVILGMALTQVAHHHDLTVLTDGKKALEFISAKLFVPDVVVLDDGLPYHDGIQVLQALRADPLLESLAVVFFADPGYPAALRAEQLKADLCIAKPADFEGYLDLARNIIQLSLKAADRTHAPIPLEV